jgi:hypothetical protein
MVAVLIWIVLVGGFTLYVNTREPVKTVQAVGPRTAEGAYVLEITPSFAPEPDPFALRAERETEAPAVVLTVNGKEALRIGHRIEPGIPIRVEPVPGLVQGDNELFIEANPPLTATRMAHAVRVRLLHGERTIGDRSFWSEPGSRIAETFRIVVIAEPRLEEHDRGH